MQANLKARTFQGSRSSRAAMVSLARCPLELSFALPGQDGVRSQFGALSVNGQQGVTPRLMIRSSGWHGANSRRRVPAMVAIYSRLNSSKTQTQDAEVQAIFQDPVY